MDNDLVLKYIKFMEYHYNYMIDWHQESESFFKDALGALHILGVNIKCSKVDFKKTHDGFIESAECFFNLCQELKNKIEKIKNAA